jgi:hypothetical protein
MVCTNENYIITINWDNKLIYAFIHEPTEYERKLIEAVNSLPCICRKTIILFAFEQIEREDIAAILKTSIVNVQALINLSGLLLRISFPNLAKNQSSHKLNRIFSNWPWLEYAELAKLRNILHFLK